MATGETGSGPPFVNSDFLSWSGSLSLTAGAVCCTDSVSAAAHADHFPDSEEISDNEVDVIDADILLGLSSVVPFYQRYYGPTQGPAGPTQKTEMAEQKLWISAKSERVSLRKSDDIAITGHRGE